MPFIDYANMTWQPFQGLSGRVPSPLEGWLLDSSSLTARLKEKYHGDFRVEVIRHIWAEPTCSERQFLGQIESEASIREVLLVCGGRPRVFARSVLPASSLAGPNEELLALGCKPLGEFLFANKSLRRGGIELAQLPASQFNRYLEYRYFDEQAWGRRSLFYINDKPISVCEVFLPDPGGNGYFSEYE